MHVKKILVKGEEISIFSENNSEYVSLTDIARYKNPLEPKDVVKNWMRSRTTIEYIGLWESLHNPKFKGVEFDHFLFQAGSNSFVLSNLESINAVLINNGLSQRERLIQLNNIAITQMKSLISHSQIKKLK